MTNKTKFIAAFGIAFLVLLSVITIGFINKDKISSKIPQNNDNTEIIKEAPKKDYTDKTNDKPNYEVVIKKEWPEDMLGGIQETPGITVDAVYSTDEGNEISVTYLVDTYANALSQLKEIKSKGYETRYEEYGGNNIAYEGYMEDKVARLSYHETGICTTTYINNNEIIDSNGDSDIPNRVAVEILNWPNEFIKGLPVLEGNISEVIVDENVWLSIKLTDITKDTIKQYIKEIKEFGFNLDETETVAKSQVNFTAYNNDNVYIQLNWFDSSVAIEILK